MVIDRWIDNESQTYFILPDSSKQHSIELGEVTIFINFLIDSNKGWHIDG